MITLGLANGTAHVRSVLFTPASRPERIARALASEADAVVIDLEDSVAAGVKVEARRALPGVLATVPRPRGKPLFLRINALTTTWSADDLGTARSLDVDGIFVPKFDADLLSLLPGDLTDVIALIETARGIWSAYDIARDHRVKAIMTGWIDLATELDADVRHGDALVTHAASRISIDAAAAGLHALIDGPCADYRDDRAVEHQLRRARSLGFGAKACIHPSQTPVVNRWLCPTEEEVAQARQMLDVYDRAVADGQGAVGLGGVMIDAPVAERARRIVAAAARR